MDFSYLDKNVKEVRDLIEKAKMKASRTDDVLMLAAIKSGEIDEINYLHESLGINDVGENRVQQLLSRYELLSKENLNIHFIGHLQTNKVKYIIDKVKMIHSLDSERLAAEIDKQAKKAGVVMDVLIEINSGREENKDGVLPEDVLLLCESLSKYENVRLRGFMTMAPKCESYEEYVGYFSEIRTLATDIWQNALKKVGLPVLSMGMSESFEAAIECGSTIVRVGRTLFKK